MTPTKPDGTPYPKSLTDSQREMAAVAGEAAASATIAATRGHATPTSFDPPTALEYATAKRLLDWQKCKDPGGPIYELREELKEKEAQREKAMKKTIALATFVIALVTGGIQVWGKVTAHAATNAELIQAMHDLKA